MAEYRLVEAQIRASSAKYRTLAAPALASIEEILQKSLDTPLAVDRVCSRQNPGAICGRSVTGHSDRIGFAAPAGH